MKDRTSGFIVVSLLLLFVAGSLSHFSREELSLVKAKISQDDSRPPLYLPQSDKVRLITLGFDNVVARILWFHTINYFGKQFNGSHDYRWLSQMCNLVTELDPNAEHVFEFCSSMLSWIAKEPEKSNELLKVAIEHHPLKWRYRYLRAFNYWYFLDDKEAAAADLNAATKLPDAPPFLGRIAARLLVATSGPETAISFLKDLLKNAQDETAKEALTEKLKRAQLSLDLKNLRKAVDYFKQQNDRTPTGLEELVQDKIITRLPKDPFGGTYVYNPENDEVTTSSGEEGLQFTGKTARTGAMKHEFNPGGNSNG